MAATAAKSCESSALKKLLTACEQASFEQNKYDFVSFVVHKHQGLCREYLAITYSQVLVIGKRILWQISNSEKIRFTNNLCGFNR